MSKKTSIPKEDIPKLTDEQVLAYGDKIISMPLIPAYWKELRGKEFDRSAPLQARKNGKIIPIGINRNTLYFWKREVAEYILSAKVGRPRRKQSDEK